MVPALEFALQKLGELPNATYMPLVFLFTDGAIGDEEQLFRRILGKGIRVFTFGIGSAPNDHLIATAARITQGDYRFVRSPEEVQEVVHDFLAVLDSPSLANVHIDWLDFNGQPMRGVETYPSETIARIYADRPVQLFSRFEGDLPVSLQITLESGGTTRSLVYALDPVVIPHAMVSRLFGRAKIDQFTDRLLAVTNECERAAWVEKITQTALEYQLVTPYTSRVAVEEKVVQDSSGELLTVTVPVNPPKGWAMFQTATQDALQAWIGGALVFVGLMAAFLRRRWA